MFNAKKEIEALKREVHSLRDDMADQNKVFDALETYLKINIVWQDAGYLIEKE